MDRAEQTVAQEMITNAGCDTHVAQREFGHEGMKRLVLSSTFKVVAKPPNYAQAKVQLWLFWIILMQCAVIGVRLGGNRLGNGNKVLPQFNEHSSNRISLHALIRKLDNRIGNMLI